MLLAKKYSGLEVDIWSLGVILYTLLCGALPFDDDDENEMKHKIIKGEYEMEEFLSNEAKDLIRSILQLEPSERPTLKQILQHTWFTIKDEEEEYNDDDDDWSTDDIADDESISSIEEENSVKEPTKEVTAISHSKDSHLDATSHLERQRQEIFLTKQNTSPNNYPMIYTRYSRYNNNNDTASTSTAPSAFRNRMKVFTPAPSSSTQKSWGPSTSKTSRRSSIDSKAFNEKVLFTTPEEKELLEKLDNLGFDIVVIKNSVLEGKVDSASGLWWLLLAKLRKKKKIEGAQSSVTTVDVAVGTSDDEINIEEETEEENEVESPINNAELNNRPYHEEEEEKMVENPEEIIPPTPPPKTYHAAPASRERRKSLILSHPEAVEPVLTTITAMASPPLSPKKYSSITSPISSRSVSPIPLSNPAPVPISNGKSNHRKKGFLSTLSTIKGWWNGSNNPKDANNAYKKSMLNWAESGVVVPADLVHTKSRFNRRSGNKTPPGYDGTNINLSRRSSINRNSLRDKKKKRGSIQGSKGNKRTTPAPITISPVTPSVVLSQNSPTSMLPIPGTPPAARPRTTTLFTKNRRNPFSYPGSSWGRKQVKRRSIGANSINILVDNFNAASGSGSGSGSSENNNNINNQDIFEKNVIENIIPDEFESKIIKGKSTIDEQLMVVESSKSKTIILASPPPTPPPLLASNNDDNIKTNPSQISKQEHIELQKVDVSPHKITDETLASSDDGDESEYVDAASTFTSTRTASPSPSTSTSASPSPNNSPVIKPDGTIMNPPAFPSPPSRQPIQISISPPRNLSQSPTSPVSPPLSPTDCDVNIPLRNKKSHTRLASFPSVDSDVLQTSSGRGKQSEEKVLPVEKPLTTTKSVMNHLMSTPPESPRSSSPTPSSPHLSKPFSKLLHSRSHSLPSTASSLNIVNEESIEDNHHSSNTNGAMNNGIDIPISSRRSETSFRRDSSPSPPNMPFNVSQMMFLHNNGINPRRGSPLIPRNSRRQPAMIMEEDEES